MATNFPNSPSNGDTHTFGGAIYTYNSTRGAWLGPSSGGGGGASVTVSDTAPSSPSAGDLWWDSAGNIMFIYYTDADSSQWIQATTPGADGAAGSAAVYATIDLLPASANTGDQAFVTGSNRLYLWNGTGWYNIALINTNPTISGVSASYGLATDGTATTVTITASDPEGIPITYSLASDTSGSVATVTQGTGASTNVFTITPSTSSANAGTFTLTFRASDGVNLASAPAEFSLEFSVVNSHYTSALITSVGANNAVNNTFIDSSSNSHTITASGDATQTTFSPYRHGGYSLECDGSGGGYIKTDTHADFTFGTGDFTVECWYKPISKAQSFPRILHFGNYWSNSKSWGLLDRHNSSSTTFTVQSFALGTVLQSTTTVTNNQWYHLAIVRNGTTVTLYVDGAAEDTYDISTNNYPDASSTSWLNLLNVSDGSNLNEAQANGQLRDVRIVKGTAVYTSAFTPTTESLTAITYTTFLLGGLPYLADASTSAHSFTESGGDYTFKPVGPYDHSQYSAVANGGSLYFDGSGDYVSMASDTSFGLGTGDFTIEWWAYQTATASYAQVFAVGNGAGGIGAHMRNNGDITVTRPGTAVDHTFAANLSSSGNTWYHVALVRNGSTLTCFVNGTSVGTGTNSTNYAASHLNIGIDGNNSSSPFTGIISDFRLVKGTAVYTADFTSPTAPLTAITGTSLLLKGTNAGIIDKSQSAQAITLNGDVKSSTTQYKYLTSSMYFDPAATSATNYITAEDCNAEFGTGDFTVECWIWPESVNTSYSTSSLATILDLDVSVNSGTGWFSLHQNNAGLQFASNSAAVVNVTSGLTAQQWNHVAVVRNGTTVAVYIDGVSQNTATNSSVIGSIRDLYIGRQAGQARWYEGYISDVRISKGLARYTSAFTPPTAALKG